MGLLDPPAYSRSTANATFAPLVKPRRRDLPGVTALPAVMATPYTVTSATSSAGAAVYTGSAITSPVLVSPFSPQFRFTGCKPTRALVAGSAASAVSSGTYPSGKTSASPWEVEFMLYTVGGAFDIISRDAVDSTARLVIDDKAVTPWRTLTPAGSSGSVMRHAVTGLPAGWHKVRIEGSGGFYFTGLVIGPLDLVNAVQARPQLRCIVVGDSWTEPTVVDARSDVLARGFPQFLQYLTGWEIWSAGSGGTGYLNPGTGGRVKFRDRLSDITAYAPDVVIWNGGTNDIGKQSTLSYGATEVQTEAAACFAAVKAALPNALQIVLGPTIPRDLKQAPSGADGQVPIRDAIKAAALAAGAIYVDMMEAPTSANAQASGTLAAASLANATTISSTVPFDQNTMVRIGTGATAEYRRVQSSSGSGPYTLGVQDGGTSLALAHSAGEPIVPTAPAIFTGTGTATSPAGSGTADKFRGSDTAHPTNEGHLACALWIYQNIAAQLPA